MSEQYFLYSDGNRFPKINRSGFGGYIQKNEGQGAEVLVEYTKEIASQEHKHNFELWGLITGLEIARDMKIEKLICRGDDKTLMSHINSAQKNIAHLENIYGNKRELVARVLELSKNIQDIKFEYVPRQENKYSDALSRKYIILLEKSFLAEHEKLLDKSKQYFLDGNKTAPAHSIYFHSDNLTMVPFENNPFLVSQKRNKKQKEFRKQLVNSFDSHWMLEAVYKKPDPSHQDFGVSRKKELDGIELKRYNPQEGAWDTVQSFLTSNKRISLYRAIDLFNKSLDIIAQHSDKPWVYSNIEGLTDVFHQRKPLAKEIYDKFLLSSDKMKNFEKIIYHRIPKDIELNVKKTLRSKNSDYMSADKIIELMKLSTTVHKRNKYFGQLMSIMIKEWEILQNCVISNEEKNVLKDNLLTKINDKQDRKIKV